MKLTTEKAINNTSAIKILIITSSSKGYVNNRVTFPHRIFNSYKPVFFHSNTSKISNIIKEIATLIKKSEGESQLITRAVTRTI